MADKEDGPPPLENPNSPSYVCVECHNNEDSLCLECHEMAQLPPNPNRNGRKVKDDAPTEPRDAMSGNDSTSDDSAYHASTICDSPTSTTSTLDLNPAEHSNDCNESHGIRENLDEACFSPRYKPIPNPNEFQLTPTRSRMMSPLEESKKKTKILMKIVMTCLL